MELQQLVQSPDQLQLINLAEALERTGDDAELLSEVAREFLDTCEEALQAVAQAVEMRNAEDLEHSAHSLKGAIRNFGAEDAQAAAYRLEMIGRLSEFEDSEAALAHLRTTLAELRREMKLLARR